MHTYKNELKEQRFLGDILGISIYSCIILLGTVGLTFATEKQIIKQTLPVGYVLVLIFIAITAAVICGLLFNAENATRTVLLITGIAVFTKILTYLAIDGDHLSALVTRIVTAFLGGAFGYWLWYKTNRPRKRKYKNR